MPQTQQTQTFEVTYEITSGIDDRQNVVSTGRIIVSAPDEDSATDALIKHVQNADPYFDDRIDPAVTVASIDKVDSDSLMRFASALVEMLGDGYVVVDNDVMGVEVHKPGVDAHLVVLPPSGDLIVDVRKVTTVGSKRLTGFEWEGPEGDPQFRLVAFFVAQHTDGYLA